MLILLGNKHSLPLHAVAGQGSELNWGIKKSLRKHAVAWSWIIGSTPSYIPKRIQLDLISG
jgi:hypothetical protein